MKLTISIPEEKIGKHVHVIRNKHVVLDKDLAALIGIPTVNIKKAVRNNINRFPPDHMFSLNKDELDRLSPKISTTSIGGMKYAPMAFTFEGVDMLTSLLNREG